MQILEDVIYMYTSMYMCIYAYMYIHTHIHTQVYIIYFHGFKIHPNLKQSHGTVVEKRPPWPGTYSVM